MNLKNYYWYFKSVIPKRICDEISKYGKQLQDGKWLLQVLQKTKN